MDDDLAAMLSRRGRSAERPLNGLTLLLVEDSRYASEAVRLLSLRSGARIRRADCLRSAQRHLQSYRPDVVLVDLGLPDGSGTGLIAELAAQSPRRNVVLGTSGDAAGEAVARAAGADGFLPKPVASLANFQAAILRVLPAVRHTAGPRALRDEVVEADPLALREDLAQAAAALTAAGADIGYVAQFLLGLARLSHDLPLEQAVRGLATGAGGASGPGIANLHQLLQRRIDSDTSRQGGWRWP